MTENTGNTIPLVSDQLLEDYSDGRLDPQTERRVEGLIANDYVLRDKVLRMIAVREAVRNDIYARAGEPSQDETWELVSKLERRLEKPKRGGAARILPYGMMAASLVTLAVIGGYNTGFVSDQVKLQQAAVETLLTPTASEADLHLAAEGSGVKGGTVAIPASSDKSAENTATKAMPEIVPDFSKFGFDLVETRLIAGEPEDAVHLLYEGTKGRRLSLYYSGSDVGEKQQVSVRQEGPLALLFWYAEGRSFSMIGEVQRNELLDMAGTVTKGISVEKSAETGGRDGTKPSVEPSKDTETEVEKQSDA